MALVHEAVADLTSPNPRTRATAATILGQISQRWPAGTLATIAAMVIDDPEPAARAAALSAAIRKASPAKATNLWRRAAGDPEPPVRLAAARLAPKISATLAADELFSLAHDDNGYVAEAACFALGERGGDSTGEPALPAETALCNESADTALHNEPADAALHNESASIAGELEAIAEHHADALVREAAVAALGSIGHETSLPIILAACQDKPAVRRRAVLALANYYGPEVDAAVSKALTDSDWQVRQAAEDLSDDR